MRWVLTTSNVHRRYASSKFPTIAAAPLRKTLTSAFSWPWFWSGQVSDHPSQNGEVDLIGSKNEKWSTSANSEVKDWLHILLVNCDLICYTLPCRATFCINPSTDLVYARLKLAWLHDKYGRRVFNFRSLLLYDNYSALLMDFEVQWITFTKFLACTVPLFKVVLQKWNTDKCASLFGSWY